MVFFRKYLGELVREKGGVRPFFSPAMYTINDFFCLLYDGTASSRLNLLTLLYSCYAKLYPGAEPLDDFIFWGDILLADFDDVDKYLVDAGQLFTNVADLKSIRDDYSYLSEAQRRAVEHFLSHFRDSKGPVKARFLKLWNILYPLYKDFGKCLKDKGMAYEGMVYRALAERLGETPVVDVLEKALPGKTRYVFIGLNALNECEKTLLRRMRDAGVAEFVWDYVSPLIRDGKNASSFFMKDNVKEFPQSVPIVAEGEPLITVVSVPSSVGQAKLAPRILEDFSGEPVRTAFVLPDENLLLPLLSSIPYDYDSINVTMGYPMKGSAVYTLVKALAGLQLRMRRRPDGWYFYHRNVEEVFSSSLFVKLLSPDEAELVRKVKADAKYYVPAGELSAGEVLSKVFSPVITEPAEASARGNRRMCAYLSEIVGMVGRKLAASGGDMALELDFAKRLHMELNLLDGTPLDVLPATWLRVLDNVVLGISVPFKGEPLKGLQIMGPLETRALDFSNLVILSANEGVFPRHSVSESFIPPELRKVFGLPTYEYQDAVWAYYFYRMIQRAEKVWILYDSRTEGLHSGEESRYIKQLEYDYGIKLRRLEAQAPLLSLNPEPFIPKTSEDVEAVKAGNLSASTLQCYLYCPAKFYYKAVKKLKTREEVAESLDSGMIGNVFHGVMEALYDGRAIVTAGDIRTMKQDSARLKSLIREGILREMHSMEVSGRNLVIEEVLLDYVKGTLDHDLELLSGGSPGFRILGLEQFMQTSFHGFHFVGYVDRMDSYREGEVRIVDYKTGKVEDEDILINDANAAAVVDKLFGKSNLGRPKIALQLFLYGLFAHADPALKGKAIVNSIYSTGRLYTGPLPDVAESTEFSRLAAERLEGMLDEITDTSVPWTRTDDLKTCAWCDFKAICGR